MNDFSITSEVYASKGKRFANFIIDRILFYGLIFGLGAVIGIVLELTGGSSLAFANALENVNPILDLVVTTFLFILFYTFIEFALKGRTIAKLITKTKVVDEFGDRPNFQTYFIRSACRFIPFEPFSFLGDEARGWHDTISKTFVVDVEKFERSKKMKSELEELGKPMV